MLELAAAQEGRVLLTGIGLLVMLVTFIVLGQVWAYRWYLHGKPAVTGVQHGIAPGMCPVYRGLVMGYDIDYDPAAVPALQAFAFVLVLAQLYVS